MRISPYVCTAIQVIDLVRMGVSYVASDYVQSITTNRLALNWDLGELPESVSGTSTDLARKRKLSPTKQPSEKRQRAADGEASTNESKHQTEGETTAATSCFVNLLDRENELLHKVKLVRRRLLRSLLHTSPTRANERSFVCRTDG